MTCSRQAAHASAYPWEGVNAADAMVVAQIAIGLLRQQLQPGDRVHGIVTKGGHAANIIPAETTADFMVRAATSERLEAVVARVADCFEAGALATGASDTAPFASPSRFAATASRRPVARRRIVRSTATARP